MEDVESHRQKTAAGSAELTLLDHFLRLAFAGVHLHDLFGAAEKPSYPHHLHCLGRFLLFTRHFVAA
jgi:hypothetical protein